MNMWSVFNKNTKQVFAMFQLMYEAVHYIHENAGAEHGPFDYCRVRSDTLVYGKDSVYLKGTPVCPKCFRCLTPSELDTLHECVACYMEG